MTKKHLDVWAYVAFCATAFVAFLSGIQLINLGVALAGWVMMFGGAMVLLSGYYVCIDEEDEDEQ